MSQQYKMYGQIREVEISSNDNYIKRDDAGKVENRDFGLYEYDGDPENGDNSVKKTREVAVPPKEETKTPEAPTPTPKAETPQSKGWSLKVTYEHIDINFKIKFTNDDKSNVCEVSMFNLSKSTRDKIIEGSFIRVTAGYEEFKGVIFVGVVDNLANVQSDSGDVETKLICTPNAVSWNTTFVNQSWAKNSSAQEVARQIISMAGWNVASLNVGDLKYSGGKVFRKPAKDTNTILFFDNGKVYLHPEKSSVMKTIILKPMEGLLGSPEKKIRSEKKLKSALSKGSKKPKITYNVKSALRYDYQADTKIVIKGSKHIDPIPMKIFKGEHIATDSDFHTNMELVPL